MSITLIGSGLAGALASLYLAQAGFEVDLYERRPDMRQIELPAGRSINLALSARGIKALREVGVLERVMTQALPMKGRMMHDRNGRLSFQPYGLHAREYINSISRSFLNEVLMDAAEVSQRVRIHFEQRCLGYDFERAVVLMRDQQAQRDYELDARPVIGADGAGSALRLSLIQRLRVNYEQAYLPHGYKELTIPPTAQGGFQMDAEALHIWPRRSFMLIALPNPDGSFTCTLFLPFEGQGSEPGFDQLHSAQEIEAFFERDFPDVIPLIPSLSEEFLTHPTGVLSTIRLSPWHVEDQLLLLGDASHAIVPFFGQGMNAAFEDCTQLNQVLQALGARPGAVNWAEVFARFHAERKADADAIAEMALDNFVEMRDSVADADFLLRKQVGLELEKRYPEHFIPKYSLVSFHTVPYAHAQRHGALQQALLKELCAGCSHIDEIDWAQADRLMKAYIEQAPPLSRES